MGKLLIGLALITLILAFFLGALLSRSDDGYQRELQMEHARRLQWVETAFLGGLVGVVLLALGGGVFVGLRLLNKRASTIYPDRAGLFPIVRGHVGRAEYYHDPNRAPTPTTVYLEGVGTPTVQVLHITAQGAAGEQLQITSQAQAAQLVAAATRQAGGSFSSRQLVEAAAAATRQIARPIPEATPSSWEPSHVERLLSETTDYTGSHD